MTPDRVTLGSTVELIEELYLYILQVPPTGLRVRNQALYAKTRDMLAMATKRNPQTVQEEFEDKAADLHFFAEPPAPTTVDDVIPMEPSE